MIEQFITDGIISAKNAYDLSRSSSEGQRCIFLDASFVLPTSDQDVRQNYLNEHIEGALFFDIKAASNTNTDLPHMMPTREQLSLALSELGIRQNDFIIIYGQDGMIMGPARVWWTLSMFGHKNVVVLDGGYPVWKTAGYPVHQDVSPLPYSKYEASPPNSEMICTKSDVISISDSALYPIIDARAQKRFLGETPEPRAGMKSGHIPNSVNLPCSMLVTSSGTFKAKEDITTLFQEIDLNVLDAAPSRIITTCGSGITACALALALYYTGYYNVSVYDGSWSEWGLENSGTRIISG